MLTVRKILYLLSIIFAITFCFLNNAFAQNTYDNVYKEPYFEIYSTYKSAMGGVSLLNLFDPYSFFTNSSISPFQEDILKNFYISGWQGKLSVPGAGKFYPFLDYDKLEENMDDDEYLRSFQSIESMFGMAGPLQMMFRSKYFSAGIFTNYQAHMKYEEFGLPPGLNLFSIDKNFMVTFGLSYAFDLSPDDEAHEIKLGFGGRFKYILRDSYRCSLDSEGFSDLLNHKDDPIAPSTFYEICDGYSRKNAIGIDLATTFKYDSFLVSFSFNDISFPYEDGSIGTKFSGKDYGYDQSTGELYELPASDIVNIIPSSLNLSLAFHIPKFDSVNYISDLFFEMDIIRLFSSSFDLDNVKFGSHITFVNIINVMVGTDLKTISIGTSVKYLFFDVGISYKMILSGDNPETNYMNIMGLIYF